jgi:hypothetical protein
VVEPYGHVVPIQADADGFVQACETFLQRGAAERQAHDRQVADIIARTSWDATAAAMGELIARAEAAREAQELAPVANIAAELARASSASSASAAAS